MKNRTNQFSFSSLWRVRSIYHLTCGHARWTSAQACSRATTKMTMMIVRWWCIREISSSATHGCVAPFNCQDHYPITRHSRVAQALRANASERAWYSPIASRQPESSNSIPVVIVPLLENAAERVRSRGLCLEIAKKCLWWRLIRVQRPLWWMKFFRVDVYFIIRVDLTKKRGETNFFENGSFLMNLSALLRPMDVSCTKTRYSRDGYSVF